MRAGAVGVAFGIGLGVLAAYHQFKLPPALPVMIERYGYDRVLAGAFMSIYAATGLVLSWHLGRWVARLGGPAFVHLGLGLALAGTLITLAWPEHGTVVLLGRAVEGAGFAILAVVAPLLANLNAGPRQAPLVLAVSAAWIPMGQLIVNGVGMVTLDDGDWASGWWISAALTVAATVTAIYLGRVPGVDLARTTTRPAIALPSRRERRIFIVTAAAYMLWAVESIAWLTWLPQFLVERHGLTAGQAVAVYSITTVTTIVFNFLAGIVLRAGISPAPLLAFAIACQGLVWALMTEAGIVGGMALLVLFGIGQGLAPSAVFAVPNRVVGPGLGIAHAFARFMVGRNFGVLLGPLALAQILSAFGAWELAGPVFAAISAAGVATALVLTRPLRGGSKFTIP